MNAQDDRVATFRGLHASGLFIMPNPWDVGSARVLAQQGFPALATTSAGLAWSLGRADTEVTLDEALDHFREIVEAVDLPINADFEDAYAADPDEVHTKVTRAVATGVAGLSVEDSTRGSPEPLHDLAMAVERVTAARQAIDESGTGVLLTARSEGFVVGRPDIDDTIRRLVAYAEAGADVLYAPRITSDDDIRAVVAAVSPKPVNLLINAPFMTVVEAAALGVRRVSVGGTLARAAWGGMLAAASEIATSGMFTAFSALPNVDALFHSDEGEPGRVRVR